MRVNLNAPKTIELFIANHASGRPAFNEWIKKLKQADWENPNDIKGTFPSTDILGKGNNRVVFDVGGNNYRMICEYLFGRREVHLYICWIGTHAEYNRLCSNNQQYNIVMKKK